MPNGLKISRPNARREKMERTIRKQRTRAAPCCFSNPSGQLCQHHCQRFCQPFLKVFVYDVSPMLIVASSSDTPLDCHPFFLQFLHCLLLYLCLVTVSQLLDPLFHLRIQLHSFSLLLATTHQLTHWNIMPYMPATWIVILRSLIHHCMHALPHKCPCLGLLPLSHCQR